MNPNDLQTFARTCLEPRLPSLKRREQSWPEPSDDAFVCPVEFVATPIEWIKCSLVLVSPPAHLQREKSALVGFRFVALWRPMAPDLDIGVKRSGLLAAMSAFRHRWPVGPGAGDKVADELVAAVNAQWPAAFEGPGTVEGYARAIGRGAQNTDSWVAFNRLPTHGDVPWLETLAYAHLLMGDSGAAHDCVVRLRKRDTTGKYVGRANEIDRYLFSSPGLAVDQLYAWRHERLEAEGLLDWAAPRGFAKKPGSGPGP